MTTLKKGWNYLFAEPFIWLFRCIFQPQAFREETDQLSFRQRGPMLLRSIFPLFLCCYLIILPLSYLLYPLVLNDQRFEVVDELKQFVTDPVLYISRPTPAINTASRVSAKNSILNTQYTENYGIEERQQAFVKLIDGFGQTEVKFSLVPFYIAGLVLAGVLLGLSFGLIFNFRFALSYAVSFGILFGWGLSTVGVISFTFYAQFFDESASKLYGRLTIWILVGLIASLAGSMAGAFPQKLRINFNTEARFVVALGGVVGGAFSILGQTALVISCNALRFRINF